MVAYDTRRCTHASLTAVRPQSIRATQKCAAMEANHHAGAIARK